MTSVPRSGDRVRRRPDLRHAAAEATRYWDALQEKVPAPVLRMLVMLPWLARRMPVPFWVPLTLMLLRRISRRRARRAARRSTAATG
jgi:hypothetical protein